MAALGGPGSTGTLMDLASFQQQALELVNSLPSDGQFSTEAMLEDFDRNGTRLLMQAVSVRGFAIEGFSDAMKVKNVHRALEMITTIATVVRYIQGRFFLLPDKIYPVAIPVRTQLLASHLIRGTTISIDPFRKEGKTEDLAGFSLCTYEGYQDVVKTDLPMRIIEEQAMHLLAMRAHSVTVVPLAWISADSIATPRFAMDFSISLKFFRMKLLSSLPDMRKLVQSMADILIDLQDREIVHGDIKTDNLAAEGSTVKVFDFGMSCILGTNGLFGTSGFTPPECYMIGYKASPKQDVWSMGAVLMTLITKTWDHWGINAEIQEKIKRGELSKEDRYAYYGDKLNKVSQEQVDELVDKYVIDRPHLRDLLKRMLNMDPVKRISAVEILAHPFLTKS